MQLNLLTFEFEFKWPSTAPEFSKGWKILVKSWKSLEGQKIGLCQTWEGRGIHSTLQNSNSASFKPPTCIWIQIQMKFNSDFKSLSPHEITSPSIMPSLRCKRWKKDKWWRVLHVGCYRSLTWKSSLEPKTLCYSPRKQQENNEFWRTPWNRAPAVIGHENRLRNPK